MHLTSRALVHDERGSSLIELALILPVLLLMLLGVLDFGLVFRQYMTVIDSVRAAGEYATIYGQQANSNQVQTFATQFGSGIPGYTASAALVCACNPGGGAVSCLSSCGGAVTTPLQYMQVTATATLPLIYGVQGFPSTIPVKSIAFIRTPYTQGT